MRLNLLPRERRFYELFEKASANMVDASEALVELLGDPRTAPEGLPARIKELESAGDEITHEISRRLSTTFVTPFDRDDIYSLSSGLDDVLDYIEEVAQTIVLYHIEAVPQAAREMADLVLQATRRVQEAVRLLESRRGLEEHWTEIHRLENQGDEVSRKAIGELFSGGAEPIEIMKLKDLYAVLESALDTCEDVANVIENIVIKNA
jgi:predicted phosphate transport protein (TIGR00153 family)